MCVVYVCVCGVDHFKISAKIPSGNGSTDENREHGGTLKVRLSVTKRLMERCVIKSRGEGRGREGRGGGKIQGKRSEKSVPKENYHSFKSMIESLPAHGGKLPPEFENCVSSPRVPLKKNLIN